jgi:hypothetical protein
MKHFFRVLFALLKVWRWQETDPWDKDDAEQLGAYLRTRSGKRLAQMMRNASITINAKAVQDGGTKWACGQAAGWQQCAAYVQTLSVAWEPESQETSEDGEPEGVDAFLERMRP